MKRLYIAPEVETDHMETASMIAVSLDIYNNESDDFVEEGDFLSRKGQTVWDDDEEEF